MKLQILWALVFSIVGVVSTVRLEMVHQDAHADFYDSQRWGSLAMGAHIFSLIVAADFTIRPLYRWFDMMLPEPTSAFHVPTATVLNFVVFGSYLMFMFICIGNLTESYFRKGSDIKNRMSAAN